MISRRGRHLSYQLSFVIGASVRLLKGEASLEHELKGGTSNITRSYDRDFLLDDILNLQEYKYDEPTGECVQKRIKYILRRFKGLQTGYVILGLEDIYPEKAVEEFNKITIGGFK